MPSTKLDIWNVAISHLGEAIEVGDAEENSAAARACRRFYDVCREKALRDARWPFAKKYTLLASVTNAVPSSEFLYSYRYPVDALAIRRILNGSWRVETRQSRVPFRIAGDDNGRLILCDVQAIANTDPTLSVPWLEYTANVQDATVFSSDFVDALALLLANRIGPRVAGDKSKLRADAFGLYEKEIIRARINALNEEAPDEEPSSEFERARMGFAEQNRTPFNR